MIKPKLAIVTTHPIQYNAPWFRLLAERNNISLKVFYTWSQSESGNKYDPGFGRNIEWDIPLLDGYEYEFVENTAPHPGTRHRKGIINPGLIKSITAYDPAAILVSGWNFDSHHQCLKYFHGKIPVLFRGDSTLLDKQSLVRRILRKIYLTMVFKNIDKALYVGESNKEYFIQHGLKTGQLLFAPHAIDNQRFAGNEETKTNGRLLRTSLGIPASTLVFLFAGKLERKKDPVLLLRSFIDLRLNNAALVFVGNGVLENELKELAKGNDTIHFMDFQNQQQMPAVYDMADIFVLPSKGPGETWGLAVNEAMAAAKPVLVSAACGCAADLVKEGINGWKFEAGNEEALKEKIRQTADQQAALPGMGQAGKKIINGYSFANIAVAVESVMTIKNKY